MFKNAFNQTREFLVRNADNIVAGAIVVGGVSYAAFGISALRRDIALRNLESRRRTHSNMIELDFSVRSLTVILRQYAEETFADGDAMEDVALVRETILPRFEFLQETLRTMVIWSTDEYVMYRIDSELKKDIETVLRGMAAITHASLTRDGGALLDGFDTILRSAQNISRVADPIIAEVSTPSDEE